ncbi:dfp2-like protein [Dermatophagoides farinae]|uniref:Dfp2-like protein n=1 Tax=Dermatophagoides farinae TaxID=6954 RepID=A0A9D4P695_DERFA|nr:dfp2-like protein [Dermatophagoides farinae]
MLMFKVRGLLFIATMVAITQAKPYMNALNEAVAMLTGTDTSTGNGNFNVVDSADGSATISNPLESDSLLMPDYLQTSPSYQQSGPAQVSAAVQTKRTVEVKPILFQSDPVEPHIVDVEASIQPVQVVFRSSSSPVMVQQIHTPAQPIHVEPTRSEDEPHTVQHQVMRPVIQEIREIIQPYRRVLQEIRPVLEEVRTVVARSEGRSSGGGGAGAGGNGGGSDGGSEGAYGPASANALMMDNSSSRNGGGGGTVYASGSNRSTSTLKSMGGLMRKSYSRRSGTSLFVKYYKPIICNGLMSEELKSNNNTDSNQSAMNNNNNDSDEQIKSDNNNHRTPTSLSDFITYEQHVIDASTNDSISSPTNNNDESRHTMWLRRQRSSVERIRSPSPSKFDEIIVKRTQSKLRGISMQSLRKEIEIHSKFVATQSSSNLLQSSSIISLSKLRQSTSSLWSSKTNSSQSSLMKCKLKQRFKSPRHHSNGSLVIINDNINDNSHDHEKSIDL